MAFDLRMALMCGTDIPIQECQLVIHQPKMKEIALIGDEDFFTAIQTLSINKTMLLQGETLLEDINNFQIFMTVMQEKQTKDKKDAVKQLFPLILPNFNVMFTPRSIALTQGDINITIDQNNFDPFQKVVKQIFCIDSNSTDTRTFNPANAKAREIAEKLMKARQRVAAQKGEQGSIFTQYISVLTIGIPSMSLEDCLNLTMFQLFDLVERYMLYVNWDMDVKSRLAGGKPEGKPDNWMKSIH